MTRSCDVCGTDYEAKRKTSRYCSARCRTRKSRGAPVVELPAGKPAVEAAVEAAEEPQDQAGPVEAATKRELEAAERLDTALGQTCLALARRIDSPRSDTGSALSAVAARLEAMLAAATKGAAKATAPQALEDEVAARRAKRGA